MLKCTGCGGIYTDLSLNECCICGGILLVEYDQDYLVQGQKKIANHTGKTGILAFQSVLPEIGLKNWVSLGECNTPYIESVHLRLEIKQSGLWFKDETRNPTGSFKDRALALCVSVAKELACQKIVVASSGNGAASAAAYGARAGIDTVVVVPEMTPVGKTAHAMTCGAQINRIPGSFNQAFEYARELSREPGVMNLTTTFLSPAGIEGYKTMAYELCLQAAELPEYIFIPVGAGAILYGIYKGFAELKATGRISGIPRLIAVQSAGCAPVVRAWERRKKTVSWNAPKGVASAILDPLKGYEDNGDLTVYAIHESDGFAIAVTDQEILFAGALLAKNEGLFVEPSSAAAFAGLLRAKQEKRILETHKVAVILTGSGLKDPEKYVRQEEKT